MEINDGFIIINKEKNCTSHDCVKQIRRLFKTKKVGHTGTLDPQVTGTLPIAIGNATRFIQYLPKGKTYIGQIQLGVSTKTDDIQGEILNKKSWPVLNHNQLNSYLDNFRGTIKQIPPKVSSIHINGERAYKKFFNNESFELSPREVNIQELVLNKWDQIKGVLEIKVSCSSGTYIRSIARDLGKALNSGGCLLKLRRISACGFNEKDSIKISDLSNLQNGKKNFIVPTILALDHISTLILTENKEIDFWKTGREIKFNYNNFSEISKFDYQKPIKVTNKENNLLGIGFLNNRKSIIHPKLVLNAR